MKLTRLQYRMLKVYWRYHTSGLGVRQIVRNCWRVWLLFAAMIALSWFLVVPTLPEVGWLYTGAFLGVFVQFIGNCVVAIRMWPVTSEILDWKKISELIESHEKKM